MRHIHLREREGVTDISPLLSCSSLYNLDLEGCTGVDLYPLGAISPLMRSLRLGHTAVGRDVSFLARLPALERLDLSGCEQVEDLSPLSGCTSLVELNLCGCDGVTSVAPLLTCTGLTQLKLMEDHAVADLGRLTQRLPALTVRMYSLKAAA